MRQTALSMLQRWTVVLLCIAVNHTVSAQTDIDGIMMEKNALCIGPMAGYSSWKNYWEGTLKRDNENLGTVSATNFTLMGNYGVSRKLNVLFGLPYIKTKASAGQLAGQKGLQDLSLWVKWKAYTKMLGGGRLSVFGITGFSFPVSGYTGDFLPMSIGLETRNLHLRAMADYQKEAWFATLSGTYVRRSNITIDRNAYYTTEMHYTDEVKMPDMASWNIRAGYRNKGLIAELFYDQAYTLGGFDITRNNMPFPSNQMNATRLGFNFKYDMPFHPMLSVTGNAFTTLAGRNMGQASGFNAGIFYVLNLAKKEKKSKNENHSNH